MQIGRTPPPPHPPHPPAAGSEKLPVSQSDPSQPLLRSSVPSQLYSHSHAVHINTNASSEGATTLSSTDNTPLPRVKESVT